MSFEMGSYNSNSRGGKRGEGIININESKKNEGYKSEGELKYFINGLRGEYDGIELDRYNQKIREIKNNQSPMTRVPYTYNQNGNFSNEGLPQTKGLRQFSLRVCKKVEEKSVTTYNEVADELIAEMGSEIGKSDQKNLRRRIYDALNVLMAIGIIKKAKKEIVWLGFPSDASQDLNKAKKDFYSYKSIISNKQKVLNELIHRYEAFKNLIFKNRKIEDENIEKNNENITSSSNGSKILKKDAKGSKKQQDILYLPFTLISTRKESRINCEMLENRTNYLFQFEAPFFIHKDIDVLRIMGLCKNYEPLKNNNKFSQTKEINNLKEKVSNEF